MNPPGEMWERRACRDMDPRDFDAEDDRGLYEPVSAREARLVANARAREACRRCPIQRICAQFFSHFPDTGAVIHGGNFEDPRVGQRQGHVVPDACPICGGPIPTDFPRATCGKPDCKRLYTNQRKVNNAVERLARNGPIARVCVECGRQMEIHPISGGARYSARKTCSTSCRRKQLSKAAYKQAADRRKR